MREFIDDYDNMKFELLNSLAASIGTQVRWAQKRSAYLGTQEFSQIFALSDLLLATIGKCIAGEFVASDEVLVLLLVPYQHYTRVLAPSRSAILHGSDVDLLGFPVHHASEACDLTRRSEPKDQYVAEKRIHKQGNLARHHWDVLPMKRNNVQILLLDELVDRLCGLETQAFCLPGEVIEEVNPKGCWEEVNPNGFMFSLDGDDIEAEELVKEQGDRVKTSSQLLGTSP